MKKSRFGKVIALLLVAALFLGSFGLTGHYQVFAAEDTSAAVEQAADESVDTADEEVVLKNSATQDTAVSEDATVTTESTQSVDTSADQSTADEDSDVEESEDIATTYTKDLAEVTVKAVTEDGAFDEEVELVVKQLADTSDEYKDAAAELEKEDVEYDGMIAYDIHFKSVETGKEVEPNGTVSVDIKAKEKGLKAIDAENFDKGSVQITHIGSDKTEVVADNDAASDVEGTVKVNANDTAVKEIKAEFDVESFSTFVLTWGENNINSATIHFGTTNGTTFEEFAEETINFDTNATSINIANKFDGYTYKGATYCTNGQTIAQGVTMDSIINKTSAGWQITQYTTNDNEELVPSQINIADGSNIYAEYFIPEESNPTSPSDGSVPKPTTTKSVTANGDGTYTIQLDVAGATVTEDQSHYCNVLVVLDATRSMNGAKWTNAKAAMKTLIETLCEGENAANAGKIDFALVTFGRSATVTQNWTKNNAAFKTACANVSMVTTSGTNWEAGMRGGLYGVLNNMPDDDPTFVIFLTDGDPNVYYSSGDDTNYTNSGTTNGYNQNANTSANHSADEAKAIAAKTNLYGIYCGDSGTTPSGESYNRLASVITGQGQGGVKTIAANADTIESEFKAIAETALQSMGANSVSVDDGVPSLSSVSAQTVGEAGAFEYYIATGENPSDSDFSPWPNAPGASYSNDNGVTWDLSKVGTLPEKTTYRLKFTVWPSQEAYDLIADLNNGVVTKTAAELDAANIVKGSDGKYTLKTNSHLNTTYTFKDTTYTDDNPWTEKEMDLPTETLKVKKIWNNPTDWHIGDDSGNSVQLYLTKDGKNYLYGDNAITVAPDSEGDLIWESEEEIYISCGFIKQNTTTHAYEVLEDGHDYSIAEPESFAYYWDLNADVYHPMVINGTAHYLIQKDDATGTDGVNYYILKGADGKKHKYVLADSGEHVMTATNDRRSNLNLTKTLADVPAGNNIEDTFEYTIKINNAKADSGSADNLNSDHYVWFSVDSDPSSAFAPVADADFEHDSNVTAENGTNGYYYVASGTEFTCKIKTGWNIRFINLPEGTTYTVTENLNGSWQLNDIAGSAIKYEKGEDGQAVEVTEDYDITVAETAANGTIAESNHSYTVTYTNKPVYNDEDSVTKPDFTVVKKDENGEVMSDVTFTLTGDNDFSVVKKTDTNGTAAFDFNSFDFGTNPKAKHEFTLTETAPIGYSGAGPWTITVNEDDGVVKIVEDTDTGTWQRIWNWIIGTFTKQGDTADTSEWDKDGKTLTVTNPFNSFDLKVSKTFTGLTDNEVPKDDFAITVTYYKDGEEQQQTATLKTTDENVEYNDGVYTWTIEDVLYTSEVTAEESGYNVENYAVAPSVAVTGPDKKTGSTDTKAIIDMPANNNTVIAFTNKYANTTLDTSVGFFKKNVTTPNTISAATFAFSAVEVTDETGETVKTGGWSATGSVNYAAGDSGEKKVDFGEIIYTEAGTYYYKVTETSLPAGWSATPNTKTAIVKVVVSRNATDGFEAEVTEGTIENAYSVKPTTVSFPVKKELTVPAGLTPASIANKFTFTLTAEEGTPMPETTSYTNPDADGGTVTFGDIEYSAPGTYTYTVTETGSAPGVINDATAAKTVTVTVKDKGDGTLTATADSTTGKPLTFTNKYDVEPTTAKIPVEKILSVEEGLTAPDIKEAYTFTLAAGNNTASGDIDTPMPETTSYKNPEADGGKVTFGDIEYSAPGIYTYTVTESGQVQGINNDPAATSGKTVTVTVEDKGDGTLTATPSVNDESPLEFTNTYSVEKVTTTIPVVKILATAQDGLTPPDIKEAYTFKLEAVKDAPMVDADGEAIETELKNPAANGGSMTFGAIAFEKPGTYEYKITESGSVKGVTNADPASQTIKVVVKDNSDGTMSATVNDGKEVEFVNTYNVAPTTASFPVEKILEVPEGLTADSIANKFTFTLTAAEGTPMPETTSYTNPDADGGTVTFGAIEYTAPGTYTYTVTETGSADGVTNDPTSAKTVTVTVKDNSDGTLTATADSTTAAPLTFTNTYSVDPYETAAEFTKVVTTMDPAVEDVTFNFILSAVDGAPMPENAAASGTFKAAGQQAITFDKIKFTEPGTYNYTITEDVASLPGGWVVSGNPASVTIKVTDNGDGTMSAVVSQATITNAYDTVVVEGTKSWNDADYLDENGDPIEGYKRPAVTINLLADGTVIDSTTATEEGKWAYSFTDLPKYKEHGTEIKYTVDEELPDGFTREVSGYDVINTPVDDEEVLNPVDITLKKVDANTGNAIGTGATFVLSGDALEKDATYITGADGTVTITFTKDGSYTLTETEAPDGYSEESLPSYKIKVDKEFVKVQLNEKKTIWQWIYDLVTGSESEDFNAENNMLTVANPPTLTEASVTKVWNDQSDKDKVRPDSVKFQLYKTVNGKTSIVEGKTAELDATENSGDTWTVGGTIKDLPAYEDGYEVTYSFKELTASGAEVAPGGKLDENYTATYSSDGLTITNSHQAEPLKTVFVGTSTTNIDGQEVQPGDILTYNITYVNSTGKAVDTAIITDTIPDHTTYVENSADKDGVYTDGKITWAFKNVADGAVVTVSFRVTVDDDVDGALLQNTSVVNDGANDYSTNQVTNPTPSDPVKDVFKNGDTEKSIDGKKVKAGDELTYQITYKNTTGKIVETATITDEIPENSTYVDNSADKEGVYADGKITWTLKDIPNDGEVTVSFKVTVNEDSGVSVNNDADVVVGNNTYKTNETINPTGTVPEKEVFVGESKTNIDGKEVQPGDILTYSITYKNTTGEDATAEITDTIPEHTTYVDGSADPEATFAEGVLTWKEDVAKDASINVTFQVTVDEDVNGSELINQSKVNDGENNYDSNVTHNTTPSDPVKDVVNDEGTSIDGQQVKKGQILTYKITYKNTTGEDVKATITDNIPEYTKYVDGSADNGGTFADGVVTWKDLAVANGEEITVSFQVQVLRNNGAEIENIGHVAVNGHDYDTEPVTNTTPEYLDLDVSKALDVYEDGSPATFVFSVKAFDVDGTNVYDDIVTLTFSSATTRTATLVEVVPKGGRVEVEEIYGGADYELSGSAAVENPYNEKQTASFTNTYNDTINHGYGIMNKYTTPDGINWSDPDNSGDSQDASPEKAAE